MAIEYTFRPIAKWPRPFTKERKRSPFRASYNETMRQLENELRLLMARSVVIQLALPSGKIRCDGKPYADAKPQHPGVILSFESPPPVPGEHGYFYPKSEKWIAFTFPCDRFSEWQDNLRAIALALEALRKVDRYGVTNTGEQYRGWTALPPPGQAIVTPPPMTVEQAARCLMSWSVGVAAHDIARNAEAYRAAYRQAAARLHPDANEGEHLPTWDRLQQAKSVLDRHFAQ